jgi:hypothetical protein
MPRLVTVDALVLACQQQVDLENHAVIERPEWLSYISRAYGELWTIVFESGLQYFETSQQFVIAGTNQLAEPANLLSAVSLVYFDPSGVERELRQLQPQERSRATHLCGGIGVGYGAARFYALVDDKIYLYPTPPAGQTYELRYVPQSPDVTGYAGDACLDVVTPDGHDFLIWSVAVRACGKTEADPLLATREREGARARFAESVRLRALTSPRRIVVDYEDEVSDSW